ncbi:MAG: bifunctional 4-hydroxy-2-oxoglutarate aldolase/2-dehydro-3-deoxy-phosphogluconate aldolase [Cyanobacteria bacterium J06623_7]
MVVSNKATQVTYIDTWLQLLRQHRAIAIIRHADFDLAYEMAHTVAAAGMNLVEITWSCDRAAELIYRLRTELPQCIIGTGTILSTSQLQAAVDAGAQFAFSPCCDVKLLSMALNRYHIPFVPGVFTPTEVVHAWQQGARVVKVFPIKSLGGAEYIKCLQGPLGHIPLIPTGGTTLDNALPMLEAGAIAVGISSDLFPAAAIANRQWGLISDRTKTLLAKLQQTNSGAE